MAGLLDFLIGGGQGGGLLGMGNQPMNIQPQQQAGGIDPSMFLQEAIRQQQQPRGLIQGLNSGGLLGGLQGAMRGLADPEGQQQQQALRNYIALEQLKLQQQSLREKPTVHWEDGVPYQIDPLGGGVKRLAIQGQPAAPTDVPADMSEKVAKEARTKAFVANEEMAVKNAQAAADLKPIIDEAAAAYEEAHKVGAIGPIAGSGVGRFVDTTLASAGKAIGLKPSVEEAQESARQRYDRAQAALQARATQAQNAGQGAVSNYERELFAKPIPNLSALDPAEALNVFKQMRAQTDQTIAAGRGTKLGQAPSVSAVLDRPSIPGGLAPQTSAPAPAAPVSPAAAQTSPLEQARAAITAGAPREAVINRLIKMGIDPKGL